MGSAKNHDFKSLSLGTRPVLQALAASVLGKRERVVVQCKSSKLWRRATPYWSSQPRDAKRSYSSLLADDVAKRVNDAGTSMIIEL